MKFTLSNVATLGFLALVTAAPASKRGANYSIQLVSSKEFCSFMPPQPGDDVASSENDGVPFCTDSSLGGQVFPTGFIKSAYFASTDAYAQVTGSIDRTAYSLSADDEGGQFDNRNIDGVTCNGWDYFVNLIEPNGNDFCIRCCKDKEDCNLGESQDGCSVIVPGQYDN